MRLIRLRNNNLSCDTDGVVVVVLPHNQHSAPEVSTNKAILHKTTPGYHSTLYPSYSEQRWRLETERVNQVNDGGECRWARMLLTCHVVACILIRVKDGGRYECHQRRCPVSSPGVKCPNTAHHSHTHTQTSMPAEHTQFTDKLSTQPPSGSHSWHWLHRYAARPFVQYGSLLDFHKAY